VFTVRCALSPYIKQIRFVFKGLNEYSITQVPVFIALNTTNRAVLMVYTHLMVWKHNGTLKYDSIWAYTCRMLHTSFNPIKCGPKQEMTQWVLLKGSIELRLLLPTFILTDGPTREEKYQVSEYQIVASGTEINAEVYYRLVQSLHIVITICNTVLLVMLTALQLGNNFQTFINSGSPQTCSRQSM
jgi:hypothetical protein